MPTTPTAVAPEAFALQRLYHWERTAPHRVVLTQPLGAGAVRDYTWAQVMADARHGRAPAVARPGAGQPHRDPVEELRALADGRLRDLDGRLRLGAVVPDAGGRHDPPDPRAQRGEAAVRRQARRLGRDGLRHPRRPAVHRDVGRAAYRLSAVGHDRRRNKATAGPTGARRRRNRDPHVHLGHDR